MKNNYRSTLYACYFGFITQAIINNIAPLLFIIFQNEFKISFEMVGRLILINFGTQIFSDIIAAKYADRIGHRRAIVAAHAFCAIGLMSLGILPKLLPDPYVGLTIAVVLYAIGGGFIEVMVSPMVEALPGDAKASAMSLLHSFYCWGQMAVVLLTTLLIKILGTDIWFILPVLWAAVPLYNLIRFLKVPIMPTLPEEEKTPVKKLLSSRVFLIALVLMLCAGSSELAMSQWSSLFAERGLQVPKLVGDLLGPCLFAALMGVGRTLYGVMGHRINLKLALMASGALCVICYAVTVFVQIPVISLLGCAICGFSVSLMWPGTYSLMAERFPKGGTAMFGVLAIFGDLGAAIGPWITGLVSDLAQGSQWLLSLGAANNLEPDQMGLKTGLLTAMIFPLVLFIGVAALRKTKAPKQI